MMEIFISTAFVFGVGLMTFTMLFNVINELTEGGYDYDTNKFAFSLLHRIGIVSFTVSLILYLAIFV